MVEFGTVEKALADAVNAADKMRGLTSSQGHSIAVAVRNLTALGVKPNKVTKKDRPAQLKSILQRASLPMTEEVEAIDSVESEE